MICIPHPIIFWW